MRGICCRASKLLLIAIACFAPPASGVLWADEPIDLGTLPDYSYGRPRVISEWGDIAGQAVRVGEEPTEQAVVWHKRRHGEWEIQLLPPLPDLVRSDARAFAHGRTPVGYSYVLLPDASLYRAVVWRRDSTGAIEPVELPPPPGFSDALAYAANSFGLIVGEALNPRETQNGTIVGHAVAWWPRRNGSYEPIDLGVPEGWDASAGADVNEAGMVVGTARRVESDGNGGTLRRANVVVWPHPHPDRGCHDGMLVLPGRADLPNNMNPAISAFGVIVARADRAVAGQPTVSRALLWRWGRHGYGDPLELPVPDSFTDAFARDVDAGGDVVGTAQVRSSGGPSASASRAVIWRRGHGWSWTPILLPNPPDTSFTQAEKMNERGDVVGNSPAPADGASGALLWRHAGHGH